MLERLIESLARPGVLGLAGRTIEKRCEWELKGYFAKLSAGVGLLDLGQLAATELTDEMVLHQVQFKLSNLLRRERPLLLQILASNMQDAYLASLKVGAYAEADGDGLIDKLGPSGEDAADYAAEYAAQLVKDVDQTTINILATAISKGIANQAGVPGTGQLIRKAVDDMSVFRSKLIASTEMNDAMSQAALAKMKALQVPYKQLIASPDACEICLSIVDAGPVPVDQPFVDLDGEEHEASPIHPGCRCATTGARAPKEN